MLRLTIALVIIGVAATVLSFGTYVLTGGADMDVNLTYHPAEYEFWRKMSPIYFAALWTAFFTSILLGYVLIQVRRKKP